ncbi:hypothetical protein D8B26_007300 [Coccidioides posadasii str. Silveira]|uniref:SWI/SNF family DNA-dependent ATPase Ris1 n=3 Tax=Coccidioides posadasii TaxID=199306 RepID=E9D3D6_COCPS|nr:SNF2 family N-terminal domain containing protein [Coccidioides posadasii C735 delta SOWgp]EER30020.1 SNF2 family N-terminal domain containing protein [Coccidioides posadasii C735 delta SOWgp]EFW19131.1 SWI/SNF family DNA-dependent ATPase Ris1 [Coccidioides posadasii str. Silveira]KMM71478.1 DNA repair protein rad5 [Coccidioides posadasii RMSCC 3488]QVM12682.1 hypothetical protein D8B26_007300 [Coccidioides posadasii str. Silveira]|eukprot:XP_003072165.1 SNF2 family N-terminal domain containing protein [Coccidioides posadasii C735 delta SOWgp]
MNSAGRERSNLLHELGLSEDEDLLTIEREAFEAERWLEKRRDQERRDEALARALQESLYEPESPPQPSPSRPPVQSTRDLQHFPPRPIIPFTSLSPHSREQQPIVSHRPRNPAVRTAADVHLDIIDLTSSINQETRLDHYNATSLSHGMMHYNHHHLQPHQQVCDLTGSSPTHGVSPSMASTVERYRQYAQMPGAFPSSTTIHNPYSLDSHDSAKFSQTAPPDWPNVSSDLFNRLGSSVPSYDGASDHTEMKKELQNLLENIRPDKDLKCNGESTPEAMKYTLMDHQKYGLAWMKAMEEGSNKGGILADDMGLGKTIQALALIVSRPSTDPERKTTLVVAPVSLMHQWKREIEQKLKSGRHQLSVYILHGDKRTTPFLRLKKYDVVLTSFGTLSSEFKRKEEFDQFANENPSLRESHPLAKQLPVLGERSKWYRVIIDEAQCIKNKNTKSARACYAIRSTYRWCMSGTPMMNNVTELYSLIRFLRIGPYNKSETFDATFTRPLKTFHDRTQKQAMQKLQALLKAILLRRTKASKIDGKPILQLPSRTTEKVHTVFSEDENTFYQSLEQKTQNQFNRYLDNGTVGKHYSNVLVMLLRLRQACCHPHLIQLFSDDSHVNLCGVDLKANAKLLGPDVVARLKENEDSECPVCIDAVENAIIFFPCGHNICAECFARISDPSQGVAQGNDGTVEIKCPNCRARIDPKKITDNLSFRKVHVTGDNTDEADARSDHDDIDSEDDSDTDSLNSFIVDDDTDAERPRGKKRKRNTKSVRNTDKKTGKKNLATLKKESMKNAKAKRRYIRRLEKSWQTSSKIDKALEILREIESCNNGEKTIIFSQFTTLLDLLEVPIMREGWHYRRYDGSMSPIQRNEAVLEFSDNENCKIMLVSLKAGNAGLNLVAASQVIIFDPFWNPYIEEQAIDRAHRIGQIRPVMVHRILVRDTVEDRILELQEKKRELIENALDERASQNLGRLGTRELAFLFGISSRRQ